MQKFGFSVVNTGVRPATTTEPEIIVTVTEGKLRLNQAASKLLVVASGDRVMFLSNEDALLTAVAAGEISKDEVAELLQFAVAKGIEEKNAKGDVIKVRKICTKEEKDALAAGVYTGELDEEQLPIEDKFKGSKLASNGNQAQIGAILEFSDSTNYRPLGGNPDVNKVYSIVEEEKQEIEIFNGYEDVPVTIYPIVFVRDEEKVQRGKGVKVVVE